MARPAPTGYRTTNWKSYNDALKRRGSLLVWLDKDMTWLAPKAGGNGRPAVFSDVAIQFCLMVKVLFGLPLRQIEPGSAIGSRNPAEAVWWRAFYRWPVPDFSTLSRRQKRITVQISNRRAPGPLNFLVDSTGIKFLGDGEWFARKHGTQRRRQYRKDNRRGNDPLDRFLILLILAMDTATGDIRAVEFTGDATRETAPFCPTCWTRSRPMSRSAP
ncbi:IS5 family transposase [Pseudogemmobacter hezensis]|uniref:IS5 family transposase n=1 Tax=Pseudogemmobacter hezensis TaxID=2737662 RepID=UPI002657470D|nr:IS5 family transposase [Pseudogemmobacter hezensis]